MNTGEELTLRKIYLCLWPRISFHLFLKIDRLYLFIFHVAVFLFICIFGLAVEHEKK